MFLKVMSPSALPDGDHRAPHHLIADIADCVFDVAHAEAQGRAFLVFRDGTRGEMVIETTAYLLNDDGKTLSRFRSPYNRER